MEKQIFDIEELEIGQLYKFMIRSSSGYTWIIIGVPNKEQDYFSVYYINLKKIKQISKSLMKLRFKIGNFFKIL